MTSASPRETSITVPAGALAAVLSSLEKLAKETRPRPIRGGAKGMSFAKVIRPEDLSPLVEELRRLLDGRDAA